MSDDIQGLCLALHSGITFGDTQRNIQDAGDWICVNCVQCMSTIYYTFSLALLFYIFWLLIFDIVSLLVIFYADCYFYPSMIRFWLNFLDKNLTPCNTSQFAILVCLRLTGAVMGIISIWSGVVSFDCFWLFSCFSSRGLHEHHFRGSREEGSAERADWEESHEMPILWFLFHEEWLRPSASHLGSWRWVLTFQNGASFWFHVSMLHWGRKPFIFRESHIFFFWIIILLSHHEIHSPKVVHDRVLIIKCPTPIPLWVHISRC